ncbi:MAG: type II toxin-antitoxin system VapC family toxin [Anaerolineae bacterium]|nr:type II toxin-antitoxin system VapC family toxin [Anaerolineae bacterium]
MHYDRLVVDSGVVIKWFVAEPFTDQAHEIPASYESGALSLLAPDLLFAEVGNVVWKKQRLQGLTAADAQLIIRGVLSLGIDVTPCASLLTAAHQIAVAHARTPIRSPCSACEGGGPRERT